MPRKPTRLFIFVLGLISMVGAFAVHIFLPVIPALKSALDVSDGMAQLVFSIGLFGMAFSTLAYGSLADRYGRRPVLIIGLALFLLGTGMCAVAPSLELLLVGRLVQAVGAGCGTALVRTIARDAYGQENLVQVLSYLTMFYTLGPALAPVIGGLLIDAFGWRSVFLASFAFGAILFLGAIFFIYETRPEGQDDAMSAGGGFLRDYGTLFSHLKFCAFVLQTAACTGAFFTVASASAVLMKETLGRSSSEYGLYASLFPIGFFFGTWISSRLGKRVAIETMVLIGAIVVVAGIAAQSGMLLAGMLSPIVLFAPGFVITLAQGIGMPSAQAGAIGTVPYLAGTAAGIGVFSQVFAGAAFSQIYGLIADGTIMPLVYTTGAIAILALITGVIPFMMARRHTSAGLRA